MLPMSRIDKYVAIETATWEARQHGRNEYLPPCTHSLTMLNWFASTACPREPASTCARSKDHANIVLLLAPVVGETMLPAGFLFGGGPGDNRPTWSAQKKYAFHQPLPPVFTTIRREMKKFVPICGVVVIPTLTHTGKSTLENHHAKRSQH